MSAMIFSTDLVRLLDEGRCCRLRSAPGRKLRIKRMGDDLSAVTVEEVDAEEYFSAVQ